MFKRLGIVIVLTLLVYDLAFTEEIPAYKLIPSVFLKQCSVKDPNFDDCIVEAANPVISNSVNGIPKYELPRLDPFAIEEISFKHGSSNVGFDLALTNVTISGFKTVKFLKSMTDLKAGSSKWKFFMNFLKLISKYRIKGHILIMPINGHGNSEITLENVTLWYSHNFIKEKKSNGYRYLKIINSSLGYEPENAKIKLENLFSGDKLVEDNMNKFINENWKVVLKELNVPLTEVMTKIIDNLLKNFYAHVPYENLFLDTL